MMNPPSGPANMLIVNASPIANTSMWTETIQVQPETMYTLSFWIACVEADCVSLPTLQASVNSALVGSLLTATARAAYGQNIRPCGLLGRTRWRQSRLSTRISWPQQMMLSSPTCSSAFVTEPTGVGKTRVSPSGAALVAPSTSVRANAGDTFMANPLPLLARQSSSSSPPRQRGEHAK